MTSGQVGKDLPSELFLAGITNGCFPLVAVPGSGSIHVIANDGDADVADINNKLGRLAFVRVKIHVWISRNVTCMRLYSRVLLAVLHILSPRLVENSLPKHFQSCYDEHLITRLNSQRIESKWGIIRPSIINRNPLCIRFHPG